MISFSFFSDLSDLSLLQNLKSNYVHFFSCAVPSWWQFGECQPNQMFFCWGDNELKDQWVTQTIYNVQWMNCGVIYHVTITQYNVIVYAIKSGGSHIVSILCDNRNLFTLTIPRDGYSPICWHGREVPRFGDFQTDWVPILYLNTIQLTLSFCKKNLFVSITFNSKDIRI